MSNNVGPVTNYPNGFSTGVTIRNMPLLSAYPGNVFWVDSTAAQTGSKGTFSAPFAAVQTALAMCTAGNGDIIVCKAGHVETISSATAFPLNIAGVSLIGLGTGSSRPTFTLDTANTTTIPVSAANMSVYNCIFVANFLSIAACFTLAAAKDFAVENCYFYDTSSVLNFLNIVKSTGIANTVDGLTFSDNVVVNLGVTSNNTTILTANDIDRLTMLRNKLKWAVQNDIAIGVIVSAGVLTNLDCGYNKAYRPNTSTNGGSLINVGGTTSTGWVYNNYVQTLDTSADIIFTTTVGLGAFNNYVTGVVGASGFLIPTADS